MHNNPRLSFRHRLPLPLQDMAAVQTCTDMSLTLLTLGCNQTHATARNRAKGVSQRDAASEYSDLLSSGGLMGRLA